MGSQPCSAARAIRQNLMTFINQSCLEKFLQNPPSGLNEVIIQRNIGVVQINEIPHALCHFSPHAFVSKYGLPALFVKLLDSIGFNILLAAHLELLFHFNFNGKPVGIPSGLSFYFKALHRLITAHGILQRPCDNMVNSRPSVGSRRSLIKDEGRLPLSCRYAFVEKIFFLPVVCLLHLQLSNRLFR